MLTAPARISSLALEVVLQTSLPASRHAEILERLSIPANTLSRAHHFVPIPTGNRTLWGEIQRMTGDPLIGLHSAERAPLERFGPLLRLLRSSKNLKTLLPLAVRYVRSLDTSDRLHLEIVNDQVFAQYQVPHRTVHDADWFGLINFRITRLLVPEFRLTEMRLVDPAPTWAAEYERVFECPVRFGCERTEGVFDAKYMEVDFAHCNAFEHAIARGQLEEMLPPPEDANEDRLAAAYRAAIKEKQFELEVVSARLGMHPTALQRELRARGMTHQMLLDRIRLEMAEVILRASNTSITELAVELGFGHGSSFTRAFRRLTGSTPQNYRNTHRRRRRIPRADRLSGDQR